MSLFFPLVPPRFEVALVDIRSKRDDVRMNALRTILRPPEGQEARAVEALRSLVRDPYPPIRAEVIEALGDQADVSSLHAILEAFEDPVPQVREVALIAAAKLGDPRAIPAIRRALRSVHPEVRFQALESLAELAPEEAAVAAPPLLSDPDPRVRGNAACALATAEAVGSADDIAELLKDASAETRLEAANALARLRDRRAIPELRGKIRDPRHALDAISWLASLDAEEAIPDLVAVTNSFLAPLVIKAAAAGALTKLGDSRGAEALGGVLRAWRSEGRDYAVELIGSLGLVSFAGDLIALMTRPRGADPVVVLRALRALSDRSAAARMCLQHYVDRSDELGRAARGEDENEASSSEIGLRS